MSKKMLKRYNKDKPKKEEQVIVNNLTKLIISRKNPIQIIY